MKKGFYVATALLLAVLCALGVWFLGRTYTVRVSYPDGEIDQCPVELDGPECVELSDWSLIDGTLSMTFRSVAPGRVYVDVIGRDGETVRFFSLYVHPLGIITYDSFLGNSTGAWLIQVTVILYLALLLVGVVRAYRRGVREDLYQYRNVRNLGLAVFLLFALVDQLFQSLGYRGPVDTLRSALYSAQNFALVALPVAFVFALAVTVSNLRLMRKEGRNWRNMLGCILGVVLCLGTLFPLLLGEWLQRTTLVDVHNEGGWALYVELWVEATAGMMVAYLECVLFATVILGVKAARRIPAFDKDYILILGCQIKKDGTLTKLLQDRADRAVEFARMQREATGKELVFVPSGGRGPDEVTSEAAAIQRYLLGLGIHEGQIMIEDQSANTYENLGNSARLIRERGGGNIAFSTTNYHVFRSGKLAADQGIRAEGIGSPTKSYFWINAFIREFIATLHSEFWAHLRVMGILVVVFLGMTLLVRCANVL